MRKFILPKQQEGQIIEEYLLGDTTCSALSRKYNITWWNIRNIFRNNDIYVNNDQSQLQRKYTLNENYFDIIDTEDKAYFLGLLYSDGYNNEKTGVVTIGLQERDRLIIENFNTCINSNKPIITINKEEYNRQNTCISCFVSKHLSQRLSNLGCVQAKSLILKFPTKDQIPEHLLHHFIRGYFDGDGCFCISIRKKTNYQSYTLSIISTDIFCQKLCKITEKQLKMMPKMTLKHPDTNSITTNFIISGRLRCVKFADWIYQNAGVFLKRKYDKYQEAKNYIIKTKRDKNGRYC